MNSNQPQKLIAICIGLALTVSGCNNDNDKPTKTKAEKILGVWEQSGYGNIYVVKDNLTTEYQFTRATCLKLDQEAGHLGMTVEEINNADFTFSNNDSEVSFLETGGVFESRLKRLSELPVNCRSNLVKDTPADTFKHFWNTFNDYYAFNKERGIDWSERYTAVISKISNDMSEDELFAALSETISPLDDGHTSIKSDSDNFSPRKIKGFSKLIADSFPLQTEFNDIDKYASLLVDRYLDILTSYIDDETTNREKQMTWGITNGGVGFLQINKMAGYGQTEAPSLEEEVAAIKTLLSQVMTDLQGTPAMIVDIRLNGGGNDAVSLAIANRFTDQRLQIMSKAARTFSGKTTPIDAYIKPEGSTPYLKPVIIIAGQDTASAAEIFLIAMSNLSQVTIIGGPSSGTLSDVLDKDLPNGWAFGLSNEVYLDQHGKSHEVSGILPQTEVLTFSINNLKNGRDSAIEAALEILGFSNSQ